MGEPTLSADDLSSPDTFVAGVPYELFSRLRREEPVAWSADRTGCGFWSITRYADVVAVTRDVGTFSSAKGGTFLDELPEEQLAEQQLLLVNMDPPEHARYRSLVAAAFAPKSVAKMDQAIRQRVDSLVDQAVGFGDVDFVTDVAARLPLEVICDLMGISPTDHALMLAWSNRLMASNDPELNVTSADLVEAGAEALGYFCGLAEKRRRHPGEDLISRLVTAEVAGERLSELELGLFCILLLVGGNETTRNTIAHGALALAEHPEQRRRLREDPSLLPVAVDELLRYSSALLQFRRTATRDTTIGAQLIAEGDRVVLWYPSANRDESVFEAPDVFDVARNPNPHLAFGGGGPHVCLGAHLARLQLRILFDVLCRGVQSIDLAGPPIRLRSNFLNGIKHLPLRLTPA